MEKAGVIKGYIAIVDRERTPEPVLVLLLVKLKDPSTKLIQEFKTMIDKMPQVLNCKLISGNWNFLVEISAATPQAYATWLLENILCHIRTAGHPKRVSEQRIAVTSDQQPERVTIAL